MENGSIIEALNIVEYAKRTPPEIAAQNNNASGRKYIQDCITRNHERFTDDELAMLKAWWFKFHKASRSFA